MADLDHLVGDDLKVSPTGDLAIAAGDTETQERILRRLITSVGGYMFHTDYGAGIGGMVGDPVGIEAIQGIVAGQLGLEESVAKMPAPTVTVTPIIGGVFCAISYFNAVNNNPYTLSFQVT